MNQQLDIQELGWLWIKIADERPKQENLVTQ